MNLSNDGARMNGLGPVTSQAICALSLIFDALIALVHIIGNLRVWCPNFSALLLACGTKRVLALATTIIPIPGI